MKKLTVLIIAVSSIFGVTTTNAQVAVGVSIGIAPPELPVYTQPPCTNDGYLWSPGYWAYGANGYYWVPGVWVAPPQEGFLWTPGYWGFVNSGYFWNSGYWGQNIGFYGGVCYGYGYGGSGFYGGRWAGGRFQYNTAVWHVGGGIHNTYVDRTVINNTSNRSSFNGRGGIEVQPNAAEQAAAKENHVRPTSAQQSHQQHASTNKNQFASVNHGNPVTTARSTIGGARFNSSGHSIHTIHAAPAANHVAGANHPTTAMHSANPVHVSTPKQQPQQRRVPQQHSKPQQRPAQNRTVQRQLQPARAPEGGGGHGQGGGEGGRH